MHSWRPPVSNIGSAFFVARAVGEFASDKTVTLVEATGRFVDLERPQLQAARQPFLGELHESITEPTTHPRRVEVELFDPAGLAACGRAPSDRRWCRRLRRPTCRCGRRPRRPSTAELRAAGAPTARSARRTRATACTPRAHPAASVLRADAHLGVARLQRTQDAFQTGLGHVDRLVPCEPLHVLALLGGRCRLHVRRLDQVAQIEVSMTARAGVHIDVQQRWAVGQVAVDEQHGQTGLLGCLAQGTVPWQLVGVDVATGLQPHLQSFVAVQHHSPSIIADHDRRSRDVHLGRVLVERALEAVDKLDKSGDRPTFAGIDRAVAAATADRMAAAVSEGEVGHPTTVRGRDAQQSPSMPMNSCFRKARQRADSQSERCWRQGQSATVQARRRRKNSSWNPTHS